MAIRPLGNKLVIKLIADTEKTEGGIFIPDSAKEKPQKGEVVAVGPGKTLEDGKKDEMGVKVGEIVLFAKYAGSDVKLGDDTFKILTEEEVLGVLE
jgi:chaperonin GroES